MIYIKINHELEEREWPNERLSLEWCRCGHMLSDHIPVGNYAAWITEHIPLPTDLRCRMDDTGFHDMCTCKQFIPDDNLVLIEMINSGLISKEVLGIL